MMTSYWQVLSRGDPSCSPTKGYQERARAGWLCPGCLVIRDGTGPLDVEIQGKRPGGHGIDFVYAMGLTLVHRELLESFGTGVVEKELYTGGVIAAGKTVDDWVAVHPRRRVIIRGTARAKFRTCTVCGRDVYTALEDDNLCPPPPPDLLISTNATGGSLVVSSELLPKIDLARWNKLLHRRLDVLETPRDGLPRDLVP